MIKRDNLWRHSPKVYKSRRGDYTLMVTDTGFNIMTWVPTKPDFTTRINKGVFDEIDNSLRGILSVHPWWQDEPFDFVMHYQNLYVELFKLEWLHKPSDRHNVVVNKHTCLTLVQYNNGTLHGYSRSTDMRNGYFADQTVLNQLAFYINTRRPDCKVDKIVWYLAVPHMYVEKGLARLK